MDLGWRLDSTFRYLGTEHPCDCAWQDELRRRYLLADIPRQYWTYGFDEYYGDPGAWMMAEDYLQYWPSYRDSGLGLEYHSITMGTGKTFLLTYVARQLIQVGVDVYYRPFRDIMGLYQGDQEATRERLQDCTVLALDEVGKALSGPQGEYFAMEFENLIRDRIDSNRVTLMTTNLTPRQLDEHYPRTYSLLSVKQQRYAIDGIDVRREGHQDIERTLAESGEVRPIR